MYVNEAFFISGEREAIISSDIFVFLIVNTLG